MVIEDPKIGKLFSWKKLQEEIVNLTGKGKAKKGIFEGDTTDGELEIGQVASSVKTLQTAEEAVGQMIDEYLSALSRVVSIVLFK